MKHFKFVAVLLFYWTALAQKPVVYGHTGRVVRTVRIVKYDSQAHYTSEGVSADVYCDTSSPTNTNCTDEPTHITYDVKLEGESVGHRGYKPDSIVPDVVFVNGKVVDRYVPHGICGNFDNENTCNPLRRLELQLLGDDKSIPVNGGETVSEFRYRLSTWYSYSIDGRHKDKPVFCVPFSLGSQRGNVRSGEACYAIDVLG